MAIDNNGIKVDVCKKGDIGDAGNTSERQFNIPSFRRGLGRLLSILLDYPSQEIWENRDEAKRMITESGMLDDEETAWLEKFLEYVNTFDSLRSWQAAYTSLFDTSTKTNLYLFDFVYGTSKDRGQAMVDLKEEYLKAGLMPDEHELPDYLPMYLEYVSNMDSKEEWQSALRDIHGVLVNMQKQFTKAEHPYLQLIEILTKLSS